MELQRVKIYTEGLGSKDRKSLLKAVVKVLAEYPDFLLAEVDETGIKALAAHGVRWETHLGSPMVRLMTVDIDTSAKPPVTPRSLTLNAAEIEGAGGTYWMVQFIGPVKEEWSDELKTLGGNIKGYIPENALLVSMSPKTRSKVGQLAYVNWVGLYEPVYKISPTLMGRKGRAAHGEIATLALKSEAVKQSPMGNIKVLVHEPADLGKVSEAIAAAGGNVLSSGSDVIRASLGLAGIEKLAKMNEVKWIEPHVLPKLFNDMASQVIGVQQAFEKHGLDGEGQVIGVADTGIDTGNNDAGMHDDFEGRIQSIHSWAIPAGLHAYMDNASWDDGASDLEVGHGTHVAGSVLGSGAKSGGAIRGMAHNARLVFQAVEQWTDWKPNITTQYGLTDGYYLQGIPDDLNDLFQQAYADGARIHTNSWGGVQDDGGNYIYSQYTSQSQDIDEFIWTHKDMIILFAAGNEGVDADADGVINTDSLCVQGTAKNCITVGASENNRLTGGYQNTYHQLWGADYPANPIRDDTPSDNPDGLAAFSSRGPCDNGRIKPDVVAPGTNILSVRSSVASGTGWGLLPAADPNRPYYMYMGGTSMATPITAGTVALIRQYLVCACLHTPTAALMKAMLIHGAVQMPGQYSPSEAGTVPNGAQGWGRINLSRSLFPEYPEKIEFRDRALDALGTGEHKDYSFQVVNTTVPVKATLVWTDFPSDPATGGGLVNTLRLSVTAPGGTNTQGTPADNNVQQVVIDTPQTGTYTVRVDGMNVATLATSGARQDFALVLSAGLEFTEVYIRDNAEDDGIPPSKGCLCQSPDIWVSLDNDPAATPAPNPEHGQTNYVFVKVHNRGSKGADNAEVRLYWANPGTNLSKPYWKTDDIRVDGVAGNTRYVNVPAHGVAEDGQAVTASFEWRPPELSTNVYDPGHFCLFATVNHPDDPLQQEDIQFVRWEDNLAWKNLTEVDSLADTTTSMEFYIAGLINASSTAALCIDRSALPAGGKVAVKIPARYLEGATMAGLEKVWESGGHKVCRLEVTSGASGTLDGIRLKRSENTLARLEVDLPAQAAPGDIYPIYVEQKVTGTVTGRVTLVARMAGSPAFIANRTSGEIHLPNCKWVRLMSRRNKTPFDDLDTAIRRGYNGCRFCLPAYSSD